MAYIEIEGEEFSLEKKTMKIAKLIDDAHKTVRTTTASYKKQYECVQACLKNENIVARLLDGSTIEEIDLTKLSILFLKIEQAYIKPVEDANKELLGIDDTIDQVNQLGASIEKISKLKDLQRLQE